MEIRMHIWVKIMSILFIALSTGVFILKYNIILVFNILLWAILLLISFGYKAYVGNRIISGKITVMGKDIHKWSIPIKGAEYIYMIPEWLGPFSVFVLFSGKKIFIVNLAIRNKNKVIKYIISQIPKKI